MALLRMPRTTPPGGFTYTQPETRTRLSSDDSLNELAKLMAEHRQYKGLLRTAVEECEIDAQRQICAGMPPGICSAESGENYEPIEDLTRTGLTFEKIEAFSAAVFKWVRDGAGFVDQEEAERRAKICQGCPFNKNPGGCSCSPLWAFINQLLPARRKIDNLFVCAVCGCSLQAAVLAPMVVLEAADKGRDLTYPGHCWKRTT